MPKFKKDWSAVVKKIKDQNKGNSYKDERIYMPDYKEDGTAKATIRFLPAPDVDVPYVDKYIHYFRSIGGWFIDNCPTSLGNPCPICEDNSRLWDENEKLVRDRGSIRKRNYYANILVIEDKKNPANEGKVFLFKYGQKIHEKIMEVIEDGGFPFDENGGVNFYLKIKKTKVGSVLMPNYDASVFSENETSLNEICGKDKVDSVLKSTYPLADFKDQKQFKSYDKLKEKFQKVIGEKINHNIQESQNKTTETKTTTDDEFNEDKIFADGDDKDFFDNMDIK